MKTHSLILLLSIVILQSNATLFAQDRASFIPLSYNDSDQKADSILQLMTLDEKISYMGGDHFFYTQEIKRLGIPRVPFVDATQGIRLNPAIIAPGFKKPVKKTIAYPAPILLAATWNKNTAHTYAHSIGEECRAAGLPLLLGPGFNIYRNSQCGRNFEYFGEDPHLAGKMVENYVIGLQATGTIATLKHFVANQTDYFRRRSNSIVDERTLHEIYLPAFKAGIDAGARAVMTSYNLVNGEWAGQSDYVINTLLREDLGFKWLVMTDWFSVWDGEKLIRSGQDLEMPFRKATKDVEALLSEGKIKEEAIDRMVKSILRTFISMNSFNAEASPLSEQDYERLEKVALNTAREGIVLLRNEHQLLPIDIAKKHRILATGPFLDQWISGKGAAHVKGYGRITIKDALLAEFGDQVTFTKKASTSQMKEADIILLCIGTQDAEASDRPFDLPAEQEELLQLCTRNNPNTAVIVNSGSGINMSKWTEAAAIIYAWYMGQNGATALAEILSGKVNPSGKLPMTIEKSFEDSPAYGYLPEGESLYTGLKMRAEMKKEVYDVNYHEGIFAGYRWYDEKGIDPLFCFGHGLSYTTFEYTDLQVSAKEISSSQPLEIRLRVRNTGKVEGSEVVQLYLGDPKSSIPRPEKELKAFEKIFLQAGEAKEVTFILSPKDFQFWDPDRRKWRAEEGEFILLLASSSQDIRLRENIALH